MQPYSPGSPTTSDEVFTPSVKHAVVDGTVVLNTVDDHGFRPYRIVTVWIGSFIGVDARIGHDNRCGYTETNADVYTRNTKVNPKMCIVPIRKDRSRGK
jgi:hypothetical protein